MKTSFRSVAACVALVISTASAFAPTATFAPRITSLTQRNMFGGAGAGVPTEDDPEAEKQAEDMAKAMGMSLDEYKLGLRARAIMEEDIDSLRATAGENGVTVERDGNSPSKHLVITVTEEGKALGKEALEKEIVAALNKSSEASKKGREAAQTKMMKFIGEEMKKMGA